MNYLRKRDAFSAERRSAFAARVRGIGSLVGSRVPGATDAMVLEMVAELMDEEGAVVERQADGQHRLRMMRISVVDLNEDAAMLAWAAQAIRESEAPRRFRR